MPIQVKLKIFCWHKKFLVSRHLSVPDFCRAYTFHIDFVPNDRCHGHKIRTFLACSGRSIK